MTVTTNAKTNTGRFFEDYSVGDVLTHAVPRALSGGERALYTALYPARHALFLRTVLHRPAGWRRLRWMT